jgi:hypothetical protein
MFRWDRTVFLLAILRPTDTAQKYERPGAVRDTWPLWLTTRSYRVSQSQSDTGLDGRRWIGEAPARFPFVCETQSCKNHRLSQAIDSKQPVILWPHYKGTSSLYLPTMFTTARPSKWFGPCLKFWHFRGFCGCVATSLPNTFVELADVKRAQRCVPSLWRHDWLKLLDIWARRVNPVLPDWLTVPIHDGRFTLKSAATNPPIINVTSKIKAPTP